MCENEEDIKIFINLLSRAKNLTRLQIFVTIRPEFLIRLGFRDIPGAYQDLILHEIPIYIIIEDIHRFLINGLAKIRHNYKLPSNWPDEENLQKLIKRAVPLFIFATTVCRFINSPRLDPDQ